MSATIVTLFGGPFDGQERAMPEGDHHVVTMLGKEHHYHRTSSTRFDYVGEEVIAASSQPYCRTHDIFNCPYAHGPNDNPS